MLKFIEHPKLIYKKILKSVRYYEGNLYEDHQNAQLYMLPADLLQIIRRELINTVGLNVAKNLLYELNQFSADAIISDAEEFGFKGMEKVRYFFSIMALFGWGDGFGFEYNETNLNGKVVLKNFPIIDQKVEYVLHYDFAGLMARMFKLVFDHDVFIEEIKCKAKGDENCEFKITPISEDVRKKQETIKYNKQKIMLPKIDVKSAHSFKLFDELLDNISMSEVGVLKYKDKYRVVIKDVQSINSMVNAVSQILGRKTMGAIQYRCGMQTLLPSIFEFNPRESLQEALNKLSLLGLGKYNVIEGINTSNESTSNGNLKIEVQNSPFGAGIPIKDKPICWVISGILHNIIQNVYEKKIFAVKEVECIASGHENCVFEVIPLKNQ